LTVKHITHDTGVYLIDPVTRQAVNQCVLDAVDDEPATWITHSMGSIIAYLLLRDSELRAENFVTVGSPLGVKAIHRHLGESRSFPKVAGSWLNVFDPHDIVALHPLNVKSGWALSRPILNYSVINLEQDNTHSITGYLGLPEFGHIIER
jgi:pimeloyl-ACP methyl ester carboxylesterase